MVRLPLGPEMTTLALAAMRAGTLSAAGEALQRLPTMVQRPCTCFEPMRLAASTTPGQAFTRAAFSARATPGTAAPMVNPLADFLMSYIPLMRLISTTRSGSRKPPFIFTRRSVPPASTKARPFSLAMRETADFIFSGASYRILHLFLSSHGSLVYSMRFGQPGYLFLSIIHGCPAAFISAPRHLR